VRESATCFMMVAQVEKKSVKEQIKCILVVEEYADVFPDKVARLLSSRDVDFTINLISGARSVIVAPYRIAPTELTKLKKQIKNMFLTNMLTGYNSSIRLNKSFVISRES